MSLVERRTGPNNFNAPTTIYGAGEKNMLHDRGASAGQTGHNYEYVTEHVFDFSKEQDAAVDLFVGEQTLKYEDGIHVLAVEVTVIDVLDGGASISLSDEDGTATALATVDATATQGEILIGEGAGVGTNVAGPTVLTYASDVTSGATAGRVVVRVRFLRPIE